MFIFFIEQVEFVFLWLFLLDFSTHEGQPTWGCSLYVPHGLAKWLVSNKCSHNEVE